MDELLKMIARHGHDWRDEAAFYRAIGEVFAWATVAKDGSDVPLGATWSDAQCVIFSEIMRLKRQS